MLTVLRRPVSSGGKLDKGNPATEEGTGLAGAQRRLRWALPSKGWECFMEEDGDERAGMLRSARSFNRGEGMSSQSGNWLRGRGLILKCTEARPESIALWERPFLRVMKAAFISS